jgi:DNA-binding MarR family transcriptional regulator
LAVIEGNDRPMTAGEISAAMHTTSGSITSLIDTLVKRNLVRRMDDADDRRKVLVEITSAGQELLDEALPSVVLRVRDLLAGLSVADRRQMFALIEQLHSTIDRVDLTTVPVGTRRRPDRVSRLD